MRTLPILSVLLILMLACDNNASNRIRFKTNLAEYESRKMNFGEAVGLSVEGEEHDSIAVFLNGRRQPSAAFSLTEANSHLGTNQLKMIVFHNGGEKVERQANLMVLPKLAPQRPAYSVVNTYPHNTYNFTEGLVYKDGLIYEGTGLRGASKIVVYELESGKVQQVKDLEPRLFGEGIALVGDSIYQLTYKAQKAFVYDAQTLEKTREYSYPFSAEGWGLCFNGKYLVMSNGSHLLYFIDPSNFSLHHTLEVVDHTGIRDKLNELEYHSGKIYANVWYENEILVINAESGAVEEVIVIPEVPPGINSDAVANGIAIREGRLLITGKYWPSIFELQRMDGESPVN